MVQSNPPQEDKSPDDFSETEKSSADAPRQGENEEALEAEGGGGVAERERNAGRETQGTSGDPDPRVDDFGSYGGEGGGGQPTTQHSHPGEGHIAE